MRNYIFATIFALSATVANAALIGTPTVEQTVVAGTPAGFTVNDLLIDFEGQLFGQQMVVELTAGSIYNTPGTGANTPPNDAFLGIIPELASDSFVTIGGPTTGTSEGILVVGGSTELGMNAPLKFDDAGINIAWAPAPGVVVADQTGYQVARVTLSDDAEGAVFFFSNASGVGTIVEGGKIEGGKMSFIPEPSTCLLAGLALVGFAARRNG